MTEKSDIKSNSTWYFVTFRGYSSTKLWKKKKKLKKYINASLKGWRSGYLTSIQMLCVFSLLNSAKIFFCWLITPVFRIHWEENHSIFKSFKIRGWVDRSKTIISTQAKISKIWQEIFAQKTCTNKFTPYIYKANSILLTFVVCNLKFYIDDSCRL